ncbi:MAG TPA: RluA family pseudouridine synthase [Planctomycetota bacterium]|nr:RluA family pseudouridine synthase [Planctomycetota bacterium]
MNAGYVYRERVAAEDAGQRALDYHARRFAHSTSAEWARSFAEERVRVNGRPVDADARLRAGDALEYHRAPWNEPDAPLHFAVAFEDDDVLVALKPAGLQVLPAGPFCEHTLLHLVRTSAITRANASPIHRLGRGTSGLILFGKSESARAELARQFRAFEPRKTYLALASGHALPHSVIARHPILRVPHGPMHIHVAHPAGKAAATRVRVLRREAEHTLVAAQPITGRADQIRIHLAALGSPLVGDPLFGEGGTAKSDARPGDGGYFLHAAALSFVHPATRRWVKTRCAPPWLALQSAKRQ